MQTLTTYTVNTFIDIDGSGDDCIILRIGNS